MLFRSHSTMASAQGWLYCKVRIIDRLLVYANAVIPRVHDKPPQIARLISWQVLGPFRPGVLFAPRLGVRCQREVLGEGARRQGWAHKPLLLLLFCVIRMIAILGVVNIIFWVAIAIVLQSHPVLTSSAVLSYTLDLIHALGADHIYAIDLMTRRLVASGLKPVAVGMFFSLGHSTIVIIT